MTEDVPRMPAPSDEHFERAFRKASRPGVFTDVLDLPRLRAALSTERLRGEFGAVRVPVARMRGEDLVVDPEHGIVQESVSFADFLGGAAAGEGGYLMPREEELPASLRSVLEAPRYCDGAWWKVTRFWIAARDTVAVMHRDLADNLHTVLEGEKTFTLAAPAESARVYPRGLLSGMPNGARIDPEHLDFERFPMSRGLRLEAVRVRAGETLFLPGGWWHHVRTARGTASLNTWWARGWRLPVVAAADAFKRLRGVSR